jgi:hypothetical protein
MGKADASLARTGKAMVVKILTFLRSKYTTTLLIGGAAIVFGALLAGLVKSRLDPPTASARIHCMLSTQGRRIQGAQAEPVARAGAPRFVSVSPPDDIELDPSRPGYDPYSLAHFISLKDIFRQEPRNAAWADVVEREIASLVAPKTEALLPGMEITSVECRSTACRVHLAGSAEMLERARQVITRLIPGSVSQFDQEGGSYFVAFAGGRAWYRTVHPGDSDATIKTLKMARRRLLERIHSGRESPPLGIPKASWPAE